MRATIHEDLERALDERCHLLQASKDAIDLLTSPDAPNKINREERLKLAQQWLEMAVRYAKGANKNDVWTC